MKYTIPTESYPDGAFPTARFFSAAEVRGVEDKGFLGVGLVVKIDRKCIHSHTTTSEHATS